MTKKNKIIAITALSVFIAVMIGVSIFLGIFCYTAGPFEGTVTEALTNAPLQGVSVTDGKNVTQTDAEGKFKLRGYNKSRFVTVTTPAGYITDDFYIDVDKKREKYDFVLDKYEKGADAKHSFLQISDTEINSPIIGSWLDEVKGLVEERDPAFLIHTGDICYKDGLNQHIKDVNSETMGIPVRYVIGNHDYVDGKYGEALYESLYGPVWYSFDMGNVHYIVTPFGSGADVTPRYSKSEVSKWLANDLKYVSSDKKVVMFNHSTPPNENYEYKNGSEKFNLKDHNLIAWVFGHYHYNQITEINGVLNISTARPDSGGIDSSVSATREIMIDESGNISTKLHYFNFKEPLEPEIVPEWMTQLEGNGLFSDTLNVGNIVYVGTIDDDYPRKCGVYAVNADTGAIIWYYETKNSIKNNVVYSNGKLMAQDSDGNVYCFNAEDGALLWDYKIDLGRGLNTSTGITVEGNILYAGASNNVVAFNIDTGKPIWNNELNRGEGTPSEFVIAGNKLIISSHWDALIALDKNTGKKLWENKNAPIRFRSSTPAVIDENSLLVADDNFIMIVNLNNGKFEQYEFKEYTFSSSSQPLIDNRTAYVATANKGIIAFNIDTKEIKWNFLTKDSIVFTPPYAGEGVKLDENGNKVSNPAKTVESSFVKNGNELIFSGLDGYLYIVNATDGKLISEVNVGAPILGKAALYNNNIIITDFAGRVISLNCDVIIAK